MNTSAGRWIMRLIVMALILGIPFTALGGISYLSGDPDAVSSATVLTPDPSEISGEYTVYINEEKHPDTLAVWSDFFRGESVPVILDDISCLVCSGDSPAEEYAELCQARLPENQMRITTEDPLLVLSKGDYGRFDIIIFSKELAQRYDAASIGEREAVATVTVQ